MSKEILAKLMAKKASLVAPSMSYCWDAERKAIFVSQGGDLSAPAHVTWSELTEEQREAAYEAGTKKYQAVMADHFEIESALNFAIEHYKGQIKLELELSLIEV